MAEVNNMKDICNICSWEYDGDHGYGDCAIVHDNKWNEIPEDFKSLLPCGNQEQQKKQNYPTGASSEASVFCIYSSEILKR